MTHMVPPSSRTTSPTSGTQISGQAVTTEEFWVRHHQATDTDRRLDRRAACQSSRDSPGQLGVLLVWLARNTNAERGKTVETTPSARHLKAPVIAFLSCFFCRMSQIHLDRSRLQR